uniref:Putative secreted protein n=1 Tax=Ixodes ricinus TaxID=34613 RepID=A0A6B0TZT5_IXORI
MLFFFVSFLSHVETVSCVQCIKCCLEDLEAVWKKSVHFFFKGPLSLLVCMCAQQFSSSQRLEMADNARETKEYIY